MKRALSAGWDAFRKNAPTRVGIRQSFMKNSQGQFAQIQKSVIQSSKLENFVETGNAISALEKSLGLSRAEVIEMKKRECAKNLDVAILNLDRWYVPGTLALSIMSVFPIIAVVGPGTPHCLCALWASLFVCGGVMSIQLFDRRMMLRDALKTRLAIDFHESRLSEMSRALHAIKKEAD